MTVENVEAVRAARAARSSSARGVWLTPSVAPLFAVFGLLGGLTYMQVCTWAQKNKQARPHGLMGPTENEFLRDHEDPAPNQRADSNKSKSFTPAYRTRLHTQQSDAKHAERQSRGAARQT